MIYTTALSGILFNLVDDGIANVLGLESLRHGTNLYNYLNIRFCGGDPAQGGKSTGSTMSTLGAGNTKNYFYLFKDSGFSPPQDFQPSEEVGIFSYTAQYIAVHGTPITCRLLPKFHAVVSGSASGYYLIPEQQLNLSPLRIFLGVIGGIVALATPTLKFRYAEIDAQMLQEDQDYDNLAYKTQEKVAAWRIGLLGSLIVGVNSSWYSRVLANPLKIGIGLVQLTSALALTILGLNLAIANPWCCCAGLLLA